MPGDSSYLSQHFGEAASLCLLEAKGSGRQDVGLQAISKLSEVCMHGRQMSATHSDMGVGT